MAFWLIGCFMLGWATMGIVTGYGAGIPVSLSDISIFIGGVVLAYFGLKEG